MGNQFILHIPVKKEIYDLYQSRYHDLKAKNNKATHNDLMKALLGFFE